MEKEYRGEHVMSAYEIKTIHKFMEREQIGFDDVLNQILIKGIDATLQDDIDVLSAKVDDLMQLSDAEREAYPDFELSFLALNELMYERVVYVLDNMDCFSFSHLTLVLSDVVSSYCDTEEQDELIRNVFSECIEVCRIDENTLDLSKFLDAFNAYYNTDFKLKD